MASNTITCVRERRSGGIETKPGAALGTDLHGREPDARGAAPSTPAYPASRPDARTGRPRARRLSLLPVLALLLGALGLFTATSAEAQAPAAPTNLSATPAGSEQLRIRWTKPPGAVTGYDLQYTLALPGYVLDTAPALNNPLGNYPTAGWVTVAEYGGTGTDFRWIIPGRFGSIAYKNYRLRVRARNSAGAGDWAFVTGTPRGTVFTPSADALVSNFRRTLYSPGVELFYNTAQGFTTGSAAFGYSLRSIDVRFRAGATGSDDPNFIPQVELWSATSGGAPDTKIADLRVNSPVPLPRNARPVSLTTRAKTTLDSNTTYFVVFRVFASSIRKIGLVGTSSDNEEAGAAPGWSIANSLHQYIGNWQAGNWQTVGSGASIHIRVNGSPAPATVSLSASPTTVREGSTVTATVTLSAPLSVDVSIPIAAASVAKEIRIPKGQTTGTYEHTAGDAPDGEIKREQITVENWRLKRMRPTIKLGEQYLVNLQVLDKNADVPRVSVSDAKGWEQLRNSGRLCFAFTLDRAVSHEVWVNYWTEDGTAKAGHDYTEKYPPLTIGFAPGETRKEKCISIRDDSVEDSGETFFVVLGAPEGAILGKARGTGTIYNHEPTSLSALTAEGASGEDGPFTALDIGTFAPATTAYTATVLHGTTHVRLTPASLNGHLTITTGLDGKGKSQVSSGQAGPAVALAVGDNVLVVKTQFNGQRQTYRVTVTRQAAQQPEAQQQQQQALDPLTARLRGTVAEHDGETPFMLELVLSESLESGSRWPSAASFKVQGGSVESVRRFRPYRFHVHVKPKSWKEVTVTLAGGRVCSEEGAICTADGRSVSNTSSVTVGGPVRIRIENARAKEGKDASLDFAVTLNRAASHEVSVDYATEDDTATAGADYTATSGTLTFAAGETAKTVSVPVLDDAVDEGKETMRLLLSNPRGAYLRGRHSKAKGVIRNDDALQKLWLSRFGRTVASQTVAALEGRFAVQAGAPSHVTMAGVDLLRATPGSGAALSDTLTGLARAFGAPSAPAGDPGSGAGAGAFAKDGRSGLWDEPAGTSAPARGMTARGLLAGSSFRFTTGGALDPGGAMTGWGKVVSGGSDGSSLAGLSYASETATGILGMDWERNRLLVGVALSRSLETGRAQEASGTRYDIEGELSAVAPYMRVQASERLSFWSALGSGEGSMALSWGGISQKADISMQLAAAGGRVELLRPGAGGGSDADSGFALALKGDAFFVRTESARVSTPGVGNLAASAGDASRVRAVLEGSRSFGLAGGGSLEPSLSLGLRHDGGDAETGTGVEAGMGLAWSDPERGLTSDLRLYGLAAHESGGYEEWGASGSLRMVPDPSGRGLSLSMTPSWGAQGQTGRLWATAPKTLAGTDDSEAPGGRLDTEVGYGLSALGGTGTSYAGLGLGDSGARDWRLGWRFTSERLHSLSLGVEATRREAANDNAAEHGVTVRGAIRW